jgi:predicted nucleotidyltransferase
MLDLFAKDSDNSFGEREGYYYVKPNDGNIDKRLEREKYSGRIWKAAWLVTHFIKRFPFVRAVMVTGSLSKNSSDRTSDLDFMIITAPGRLWIARTLLMLFKKIFLLNSYKYFCINYYVTEDNLEVEDKSMFTAIEIATIKGTYNSALMNRFVEKNRWLNEYFPNYVLCDPNMHKAGCSVTEKRSIIQAVSEALIPAYFAEKLDIWMMNKTIAHWNRKYSYLDDDERNFRLRSTRNVSKAHPDSVHSIILNTYNAKLKQFNLK